MVFEGPFLHVADEGGADDVDDEFGVVDGAEVLAEQGVFGPDGFKEGWIVEGFGGSGDADLIVVGVEVAEFDLWVGIDLAGFVVGFEVGDVDGEAVGADGGDGAQARLIAIDGGKHGEFGFGDGGEGEIG